MSKLATSRMQRTLSSTSKKFVGAGMALACTTAADTCLCCYKQTNALALFNFSARRAEQAVISDVSVIIATPFAFFNRMVSMATQPPWATVGICRCCMKEKTGKCGKDDVNAAPKQNAATNQNAG